MNFMKNFLVLPLILIGSSHVNFVSCINEIGKPVIAEDMKKVTFSHSFEEFKVGEIVAVPAQDPENYIYGEIEEKYKENDLESISVIIEKDKNISGITTLSPEQIGKF